MGMAMLLHTFFEGATVPRIRVSSLYKVFEGVQEYIVQRKWSKQEITTYFFHNTIFLPKGPYAIARFLSNNSEGQKYPLPILLQSRHGGLKISLPVW